MTSQKLITSRGARRRSVVLMSCLSALLAAGCGSCGRPQVGSTLDVQFTQPADGATLTLANDADPNTPGLQYAVIAQAVDSSGRQVTLSDAQLRFRASGATSWTNGPSPTLSGATATFANVTIPDGAEVLQVTVTEQGSSRQATRTINVTVDTSRPAVTSITFQGDANRDNHLNKAEQATGAPVAIITTAGMEDGQPVVVQDQSTGTVYGQGTTTSNAATVTLSSLPVTDTTDNTAFALVTVITNRAGKTNQTGAGNPSDPRNAAAFVTLIVDRVPPTITLIWPTSNPATLHVRDDADKTTAGFQIQPQFTTSADVGANGATISLVTAGTSAQFTPVAGLVKGNAITLSAVQSFNDTFHIVVSDPSLNQATLDVPVNAPAFLNLAQVFGGDGDYTDLLTATNVTFVNPSNIHVFTAQPRDGGPLHQGWVTDRFPGDNAAEVNLDLIATNTLGTLASVQFNGQSSACDTPQFDTPTNLYCTDAGLAHAVSGPLTIAFSDDAGSQSLYSVAALVDVIPPAQTTQPLTLLTDGGFSARKPGILVTWSPSGDDGTSGSASGYDLRWSTNAVLNPLNGLYSALIPRSETDAGINYDDIYFNYSGNFTVQETAATLPVAATAAQISDLPPFGTYFVQLRAFDKVGNYAPPAAFNCGAGTGCLDYQWQTLVLTNPSTGNFGFFMRAGDLNGDGKDDLVVDKIGSPRQAYVYYGNSSMTLTPQLVQNADGGGLIGVAGVGQVYDLAIGNASTASNAVPPVKDLLVADPTWGGGRGRYLLYLGQPGGRGFNPNPIEFRGPVGAVLNNGATSGSSMDQGFVRIIDDINGDNIGEIVFGANAANTGDGAVYLFYGRSPGAWSTLLTTLNTTDPGDSTLYVPLSSAVADVTINGPSNSDGGFFGIKRGFATVGDVTGDGVADFAVPSSRDFVNQEFVFSGGAINAAAPHSVISATNPTYEVQIIDANPALVAPLGQWRGFGADAVGKLSVFNNGGTDLAVSAPRSAFVDIFTRASSGSGFATPPRLTLSTGGVSNGNFGNLLTAGDLNGDGRVDLVVGQNTSVGGDGFYSGAWVFFHTGVSGAEYDTTRFRFHNAWLSSLDSVPPQALGLGIAVGDFNGDGKQDVAVSDPLASGGRVHIRY